MRMIAGLILALLIVTNVAGPQVPPAAAGQMVPPAESDGRRGDLLKWAIQQGGLTVALIIVLASYRRDFFRKLDDKQADLVALRDERREEKQTLAALLEKHASATGAQALAVARNSDATTALVEAVKDLNQNIHRRREDFPPRTRTGDS
jgi:hypothetical protein